MTASRENALPLSKALKVALDETRMLVLGTQVLLGFQFQAIFREGFAMLPERGKTLCAVALVALTCTVGLLIAPSMQHRIVEAGHGSARLLRAARRYAVAALSILTAGLSIDLYVVLLKDGHVRWAGIACAAFVVLCLTLWFVFPLIVGTIFGFKERPMDRKPASIEARIEQMLTEARVILPGVQALLGFQLIAVFAESFPHLPEPIRVTHFVALSCNAVAMALLMTPAALHRIAFGGEDDPRFLALGSALVAAAPLFLAFGLATDATVALHAVGGDAAEWALPGGIVLFLFLAALWYLWPGLLRAFGRPEIAP